MLLCAGILGRYYTDSHDVDENEPTIPLHGGHWGQWWRNTENGVFLRTLGDPSSNYNGDVASRQNFISLVVL